MKQGLFVVFDEKSQTYTAPTLHPTRAQALRSFGDAVNGGQGVISSHPEDFTLFEVASYDMRTGVIEVMETKSVVANGLDLVKLIESLAAA
jgi:hypothetical protein